MIEPFVLTLSLMAVGTLGVVIYDQLVDLRRRRSRVEIVYDQIQPEGYQFW